MFRQPRPGEEDGRDYHYVTRETMQGLIDENQFIENAEFRSVENLSKLESKKFENIPTVETCMAQARVQ